MDLKFKKNWFLLGNFTTISAAELSAVLKLREDEYLMEQNFFICDKNISNPEELIERLGGTVKIAVFAGVADTAEQLSEKIANIIADANGKIVFGISAYFGESGETSQWVYNLGKTIKNELKDKKLSCRYVFNREPVLSSVTVQKNNLLEKGFEFLVIKKGDRYYFARTKAVQPFEEWGRRDIGRPERDQKSGTLPPKLARIMINLSGASLNNSILDPFCGSGTIISEAVVMGYKKIFGSDISFKATEDSKKNIDWIKPDNNAKIINTDISELSKKIKPASIEIIITEPFLGKPLKGGETKQVLEKQSEELKKLYLIAFCEFKKILTDNGKIIFIIPRFKHGGEWLRINCVNEIKKLGFNTEPLFQNREYLIYARADQKVGREIWKFTKTAS